MLQYGRQMFGCFDQLGGHLRLIPLRHVVVFLQHVDDVVGALRGEEDGHKRIAVVRAIDHESFHFFIADPVVQFLKLGITKAKLRHPLRHALSEDITVLQFRQSVGGHRAGVAGSELFVVLANVSLGRMDRVVVLEGVVVSVDVEEITGEFSVVEDVDALSTVEDAGLEMAALLVAEAGKVGAVEVELTNGGAFSIYEPLGCTA
jgi:hypothetical protein